jgi:hypothetical protein
VFWWVGSGVWACGAVLGVARIDWGRVCAGDRSVGGALVGWVLSFHGELGRLTPGSPSKFLMAAFLGVFAKKVTAEICTVQPFVIALHMLLLLFG